MTTPIRALLEKTLRFGLVGVLGTLLYAGLAFGLESASVQVFWAHAIASAVSLVASYAGQKIFTFGIRGQHRKVGLKFLLATAFLVTMQSGIVFILARWGLASELVLLASTLFYPPASFLIHTFWTFRTPRLEPS